MPDADLGAFTIEVFIARPGSDGPRRLATPISGLLPEVVAEAAAPVLADFRQLRGLVISLSYVPCEEEPDLGTVLAEVGDETYGFGVDLTAPAAELVVTLADGVQERLPETALAWGEALPPCRWHGHPASPRLMAGVASWVCPADGRVLCAIGACAA